jgi:hypothetical protein
LKQETDNNLMGISSGVFSSLLLFILLTGAALAGDERPPGFGGIPFPVPSAKYTQPVKHPAYILQGNGGWFSHSDSHSRHAWDYSLPVGAEVVAARAGVVSFIRNDSNIGGADYEQYQNEANFILIDHLDGTLGQYYHLSKTDFLAREGEYVLRGEPIAQSGDTGFTLGPHLHFAVLDRETLNSIPARFSDFRKNKGLPREGDQVRSAPQPEVPPHVVLKYKHALRACLHARDTGLKGLALSFAMSVPEKDRHPFYFYNRVLVDLRRDLRAELKQRLSDLAGNREPGTDEVMESLRYITVLEDVPDGAIQASLRALKKRMERRQDNPIRGEEASLRNWVRGLELECQGRYQEAALLYGEAMQSSRGVVAAAARACLARVIQIAYRNLKLGLSRLEWEGVIALKRHVRRIRDEARTRWSATLPLLQMWVVHFPEEREAALAALADARLRFAKLWKQEWVKSPPDK